MACGVATPSTDGTDRRCALCLSDPPPFRRARALFVYEGGVPGLVLRLKYSRAFWLAPALGRAMAAAAWAEGIRDADVVVPVPLTARRMCRRGYNQSALLGRAAARALGIGFEAGALRRVRDPGPQDHHGRQARRSRVRGCFAVRLADRVRGRRVLLIDDVVTTGATAGECARVLLAAGAASVEVMACAMALGQPSTVNRPRPPDAMR